MTIVAAKKGDEDIEARALSRRGFLRLAAGGAASAALPTKTFFFFGGIHRPAPAIWTPPPNMVPMLIGAAIFGAALLFAPAAFLDGKGIACPKA